MVISRISNIKLNNKTLQTISGPHKSLSHNVLNTVKVQFIWLYSLTMYYHDDLRS